eukprot:1680516-Pleurochrysis_carterae.AAC.5
MPHDGLAKLPISKTLKGLNDTADRPTPVINIDTICFRPVLVFGALLTSGRDHQSRPHRHRIYSCLNSCMLASDFLHRLSMTLKQKASLPYTIRNKTFSTVAFR